MHLLERFGEFHLRAFSMEILTQHATTRRRGGGAFKIEILHMMVVNGEKVLREAVLNRKHALKIYFII